MAARSPAPEPRSIRRWGPPALVALAAAAVYAHTLGHGFSYDDAAITGNRWIRSLGGLGRIFAESEWAGAGLEARQYRPLTVATYALNWAVGGRSAAGYHLVNVLLHAAVAVGVLRLARACRLPPAAAWAGALLFAVHPVHVEAVANVSGRKDVLATLLVVGTVLAHRWASEGARWRAAVPMATLVGAMLAKEVGVVAPALALALDVLVPREGGGAGGTRGPPAAGWRIPRRLLALHAGYAAAVAGYVAVFALVTRDAVPSENLSIENPLAAAPLGARLLTAIAVVGKGLALHAFPVDQSPDYSFDAIPLARSLADPRFLASAGLLVAWLAAGVSLRRRRPVVLLSAAWYLGALLPTSNLVFPIGTIFGERLLYLPSVGLALLAGGGLGWLLDRHRAAGAAAIIAGALALAAGTVAYASAWSDNVTLFTRAARAQPRSANVHLKLAGELRAVGRAEDAAEAARRALAIAPGLPAAALILAETERVSGRLAEAAAIVEDVIAREPANADALYCMALVEKDAGRLELAERWWRRAVEARPRHASSLAALALLAAARGDLDAALASARAAVDADPTVARGWYTIALVMSQRGDRAAEREALTRFVEFSGPDLAAEVGEAERRLAEIR